MKKTECKDIEAESMFKRVEELTRRISELQEMINSNQITIELNAEIIARGLAPVTT